MNINIDDNNYECEFSKNRELIITENDDDKLIFLEEWFNNSKFVNKKIDKIKTLKVNGNFSFIRYKIKIPLDKPEIFNMKFCDLVKSDYICIDSNVCYDFESTEINELYGCHIIYDDVLLLYKIIYDGYKRIR